MMTMVNVLTARICVGPINSLNSVSIIFVGSVQSKCFRILGEKQEIVLVYKNKNLTFCVSKAKSSVVVVVAVVVVVVVVVADWGYGMAAVVPVVIFSFLYIVALGWILITDYIG